MALQMKKTSNPLVVLSLFLFAAILCSFTFHHGWSNYDEKKKLTLTGEILSSTYENPHGTIQLKSKNKTWTAVLAPPYRMKDRGLTADMLKVGTTVEVEGYPHKEITDEMRAERITINKKTTELR
jgi:hypothetical protein